MEISSESVRGSMHPYEDRILVDERLGLFAVADGVTGSSQGSGAIAAVLTLELLQKDFAGDIVSAVQQVHRKIVELRVDDRSIGESTITAAAISGDRLELANLGDSPAFLVRDGMMTGLITEDVSPGGRITQVIGYPEVVTVHSRNVQLVKGDVLILASDGVEHILHPSLVVPMAGILSAGAIAKGIIEEARNVTSGYDDDKSVIVLKISEGPS